MHVAVFQNRLRRRSIRMTEVSYPEIRCTLISMQCKFVCKVGLQQTLYPVSSAGANRIQTGESFRAQTVQGANRLGWRGRTVKGRIVQDGGETSRGEPSRVRTLQADGESSWLGAKRPGGETYRGRNVLLPFCTVCTVTKNVSTVHH